MQSGSARAARRGASKLTQERATERATNTKDMKPWPEEFFSFGTWHPCCWRLTGRVKRHDNQLHRARRESDHLFVGIFAPQPRNARSRGRVRLARLPRLRLQKLVQSRMEFDMRVTLCVTKTIRTKDHRQDGDLPSAGYR